MSRMLSLTLTLALVAAATTTAHANSYLDASGIGIETALYQSAATAGKGQRSERTPGLALQVGGALALAQPSLRASLAGSSTWHDLPPRLLSGRQQADPARAPSAGRWLDLRGSRPALAYPVTDSLSLGLRYSYQRGEDLVFKMAQTGSIHDDYENHKILLRAQWEF